MLHFVGKEERADAAISFSSKSSGWPDSTNPASEFGDQKIDNCKEQKQAPDPQSNREQMAKRGKEGRLEENGVMRASEPKDAPTRDRFVI